MYITAHVYSMPKGHNIVLPLPILSVLKCSQQKEVRTDLELTINLWLW